MEKSRYCCAVLEAKPVHLTCILNVAQSFHMQYANWLSKEVCRKQDYTYIDTKKYCAVGFFCGAKFSFFRGKSDFVCFIFVLTSQHKPRLIYYSDFVHLICVFEDWKMKKNETLDGQTNPLYGSGITAWHIC